MNWAIASAITGSEQLMKARMPPSRHDRPCSAAPLSRRSSLRTLKAKLGSQHRVPPCDSMASNSNAGRCTQSNGDISTMRIPLSSGVTKQAMNPMS